MYTQKSKINDWYKSVFNEELPLNNYTFKDLMNAINEHKNIYVVLGTRNTVVRDSAFQVLANIYFNGNYQEVYNAWM